MAILAECPFCHKKQSVRNRMCKCGQDLIKAKRNCKVRYWINYLMPDGKQRREPVASASNPAAYSIEEARAAEGKRRAQKIENPRILQRAPEEKMTFKELTKWYLALDSVKGLASFSTRQTYLNKFLADYGDMVIGKIKVTDLESLQAKRKSQGNAPATIDQEIAYVRHMINKASDDDLVGGETVRVSKKVKKLLKRNANARDRVLTYDEITRLMEALPRHTKAILAMAFYTGMRRGEILSLTWDKVDMEKCVIRLEATDTKDKEPRTIPIQAELLEMLKAIPRTTHDNHVFLFKGKPIKDIRTGLTDACEKTGIPYGRFVKDGFIFHDLRHTFNTYMRRAGVPESVIMEITGHSTREMFDRYNTVDHDDKRQAVDQMRHFLQSLDQNVDQETF